MSSQASSLISYEQVHHPHAAVVEFLCNSIADPDHATELSRQLASLVRPELPNRFVLDFKNVRSFSSTAFGALVGFVLKVRKAGGIALICNMDEFVRFGADIIRLGDYAPIVADRQAALDHLAAGETDANVAFVP